MEFEERRPLYNWCLQAFAGKEKPRQIEFARLNVTTMITSKRKLRRMVEEHVVSGWDDPRLATIAGLKRRGYTPESLRHFCELIGISKANSTVDIGMLEYCIREDLKDKAPRIMTVVDPIKVVLTNYPEDKIEYITLENNPSDPTIGTRQVPFGKNLFIEREDFMENPIKKFFRMTPGKEVRLKGAYIIKCDDVIKNKQGQWFKSKSLNTFCPMGPSIMVGAWPFPFTIYTKVNGNLRQESSSSDFIFSIPKIIASLSEGMTLLPGDIIALGTPSGVGMAMNPPQFLKKGDEIEITIDPIGVLKNKVK